VRLDGILRVEHTPSASTARVRVVFAASPLDDTAPKSVADEESLAGAVLPRALAELPARRSGPEAAIEASSTGLPIYPLEILGRELSV